MFALRQVRLQGHQHSRKHPIERDRLQVQFTDLHAQLKVVKTNKAKLALLLDRLCLLKERQAAHGVVALCELCQSPIAADAIPLCAPAEDLWDLWQALLICPRCLRI